MAHYACRHGHEWTGLSNLSRKFHPGELDCPECGLRAEPKLKQSTDRRNGLQAVEHPAVAEAHDRFTRLVTEWECWAIDHRPGHRCWPRGQRDPHHLVPADWIRRTFADLPPDELALILYEPVIGASACRQFHAELEDRNDVILLHELDDAVRLFCQKIDRKYPGHQSMAARLEVESPPSRAAA
jgi:hypothetical protein